MLGLGAMVCKNFYGPHEQFCGIRRELISEHQVVPIKHLFVLFRVSFFTHNRV